MPIAHDRVTPTIAWTKIYEEGWNGDGGFDKVEFCNIATCFGKSHLRDEKGGDLYLNCLDIDSEEVFTRLARITDENGKDRFFINELCERTYVTKTRKKFGRHVYWFSHNPNPSVNNTDSKAGFEFEIKTDNTNGLAALPPSRHRNDPDFRYHNIGQNQIMISDALYGIFARLLDDCLKKKNQYARKEYDSVDNSQLRDADIDAICDLISPIYRIGCRHQLCYTIAGLLHKNGIGLDSASKIINKIAKGDEELTSRLRVMRCTYSKDRDEVSGPTKLYEVLEFASNDASLAGKILRSILSTVSQHSHEKVREVDHNTIAEELIREFHFKNMTDSGEIYYFEHKMGGYRARGEILISQQLELLYPRITTHAVSEIVQKIRRKNPVERSQFDSDASDVNVENGLLNVSTGELNPHSPKFLTLTRLPVEYNPKAQCTKILKFLAQVLRPCDIFTLLQFVGYCLTNYSRYEKALLLIGKGDNGKTVLLKLVEAFLGEENVSHVSLNDLNTDRFAKAELFGKMANTCGDLESHKIYDISVFKQLVSGDSVRAQKKNKDPFYFKNHAKLIFSSNHIPEVQDTGYPWHKRLIPLPFLSTFLNDKDINKIDELITPEELSGFLNLVLIALKQLTKDGHFAHIDDIRGVKQLFDDNKNEVSRFILDRCIRNSQSSEYCADIFNEYRRYCKAKGITPLEDNSLGVHLKEMGIDKARPMISGVRNYVYKGIGLKAP